MINGLMKELCCHCQKSVNIGHQFFECTHCNKILHAKCFKPSNSEVINDNFYCSNCKINIIKRYNPIKCFLGDDVDDDHEENDPEIIITSQILESCKNYSIHEFNSELSEKLKESAGMFFLNIDGNKSNFDSLSTELSRVKYDFPIIALAETNIDPDEKSVYQLENYNSFYQNTCKGKSKGTGVALYVHQSLTAVVNDSASKITSNLESLFITVQGKSNPIHVGVVYRPPSGEIEKFSSEFKTVIESLPTKFVHIMGDYNINLHNNSKMVHDFENLTLGRGLLPLISTSTHVKPNCNPSCIDNILSNDTINSVASGTLDLGISHHRAIFQLTNSLGDLGESSDNKFIQYYDFCNAHIDNFVSSLSSELDSNPPDNFTEFHNTFNSQLDLACKLAQPKCSKRSARNNPWITGGLIASINKKHELYDMYTKANNKKCTAPSTNDHPPTTSTDTSTNTSPNTSSKRINERALCPCDSCTDASTKYAKFKAHRSLLKFLINESKRKYYGRKINECDGNSKKMWEIINRIRGKNKRKIKPNFLIDNIRITSRRVIAHEFNKYFVSLASTLNETYSNDRDIGINSLPSFTDYLPRMCSSSIYLNDCDVAEVMKVISELKSGKSSDIPIHVIKQSSQIIAPHLVNYFNTCLREGFFPEELKTGRISPIYKKDDEQLLENYRPVSTLPVFGKILEKLIFNRVYSFLITKGIMHENQFGFRKGHSTNHALNYSINHIETLLKNNKHVLGIFIDLSKAFDTISHDKLLTKLNNYGIRGNALQLIKSYLSNRKQYVSVLDENSETLPVRFGVPQGSVLGPLLFLLYINDICNVSDNGKFILFADDTNIFVAADSKSAAYNAANSILNTVQNYMKCNLLHINKKKCCYIYFSPKNRKNSNENSEDIYLSIEGTIIKRVRQAKFLGVIINDQLNWKPHIELLNRKLKSACGRIYRIKNCLPESLHKLIYHTLFESHLSYGITVWGGVSNSNLDPLFKTQKKCIRILFGDNKAFEDKFKTCARCRPIDNQYLGSEFYAKESTKPLFKAHELLSVHNLYKHRCIMELFKIIKYRLPISLYELYSKSSRRDDLLITPVPSHNFFYKSASLWNNFIGTCGRRDFVTSSCYSVKSSLKKSLLAAQNEPADSWCNNNFDKFS